MMPAKKNDQYYVIGNPIKHSLSPKIHMEFALKTRQDICYKALNICPEKLEETLNFLRLETKVKGLSVTFPFKEKLFEYCDELDDLAQEAQAVSNVIITENRKFIGLNIDGIGFVNDIKNNSSLTLLNKNILILGAGGAAKGILGAILRENPASITISNRTKEKAQVLINRILKTKTKINTCPLEDINDAFDIVINATSASANNENILLKESYFTKGALGYDLMYGPNGTLFTHWCNTRHIQSRDGKGMLIELSKIAFEFWRGVSLS